jgi:hypothetical protein
MLAIKSSFKHQADRTIFPPSHSRHTAPTNPLLPPPHGHAHPKTLSALHATGVIIHQRSSQQHTPLPLRRPLLREPRHNPSNGDTHKRTAIWL